MGKANFRRSAAADAATVAAAVWGPPAMVTVSADEGYVPASGTPTMSIPATPAHHSVELRPHIIPQGRIQKGSWTCRAAVNVG